MQYMGGKHRLAKYIAPIVRAEAGGGLIWEPFCGSLNITAALGGRVLATDALECLVELHKAIQKDGWLLDHYARPENEVAKAQYKAARDLPDNDPLKAFIGFGCSFGGKWFGGLAHRLVHCSSFTYTQAAARSLARKHAKLEQVEFACERFGERDFQGVIYCDPPYRGTEGYAGAGKFDYDQFVEQVARYVANGCTVFVSEESFPIGEIVWECEYSRGLAAGKNGKGAPKKLERLYKVAP